MEKIIEDLEKDLIDIIEGKPLKILRKELGDNVDIRALRMVIFALQWTSVGYQSALRLAGMRLGKRIGGNSKKAELSLVLEEIKKLIEALRNGKVELEIIGDFKDVQLKIFESSLTTGIPNVSQNLCFFEEGFIEGYLDGIISSKGAIIAGGGRFNITKVSVEEEKCIGLGDEFCGFLIEFKL